MVWRPVAHPDYLDWMLRKDFHPETKEAIRGFNARAVRLAKRTIEKAQEIEGAPRPRGEKPKRRRVSSLPEYAVRRDLERFVPL